MAVRKKPNKKVKKKIIKTKAVGTVRTRGKKQNKFLSFIIGVVTVLLLAMLVFQYAQQNNYKQVLGRQTHSTTEQQQTSGFKNLR